jgi:HAD superfamily hydrolase (TIGR01509 family)
VLRGVLFDCNGVLVDDEPLHLELFRRILGEEGIPLGEDEYYRYFLGFDDRGAFRAALVRHGQDASAARVARLITRKAAYYRERVRRDGYRFFPGALELVRDLAGAGLTLGVVSGALGDEVEGALAQAAVRELFKAVVVAEDVEAGKPSPEGYLRALADFNVRQPLPERLFHPHEVLAIEDSPAGLEAAAAAGLVTLGVAHSRPAEELGRAHAVVADLGGLTLERLQRIYAEASRR